MRPSTHDPCLSPLRDYALSRSQILYGYDSYTHTLTLWQIQRLLQY